MPRSPAARHGSSRNPSRRSIRTAARHGSTSIRRSRRCVTIEPSPMPNVQSSNSPTRDAPASCFGSELSTVPIPGSPAISSAMSGGGWAPIPGTADSYISSASHDDAATAVVAALDTRAGIYNVVDDEPMRHREFVGSLAGVLGVPPPRLPPSWMKYLFGSLGEMMARSLRISNRKLREECGWAPKYPSMREGWRAVVPAIRGGDDGD